MASTARNIIYYQGGSASDVAQIAANKFYTNVILAAFHFMSSGPEIGRLYLNDTPIFQIPADFWNSVAQCQASGKKVTMMLGGAGNGTWKYISANLDRATNTLQGFIETPNPKNPQQQLDGIDLDWETPDYDGAMLATITNTLAGKLKGKFISHSPIPGNLVSYNKQNWPTGIGAISWLNVQWYGSSGQGLIDAYTSLVSGATTGGLAFPANKVVVGATTAPQGGVGNVPVCDLIKTLVKIPQQPNCADWGGAAGWDFTHTQQSGYGNWAACISAALQGQTTCEGCS